jgi:two-component system, NarL family, response regulator DevR
VIRVLLVDDHPAMRAGLSAVLRSEPGIVPLGAAGSAADLPAALARTRPDVIVLDYHLPGTDGLVLCRELKRTVPAPAVLMYSAYADASLVVPSLLAGADGLLHKGAPAPELFDAIRAVARGDRVLPAVGHEHLEAAGAVLDPEDLPILGMALDGTPPADIASTLRLEPAELAARIDAMVARLRVDVPAPA